MLAGNQNIFFLASSRHHFALIWIFSVSFLQCLWKCQTLHSISWGVMFTFTFMHLADAFIQSDLPCIQVIHLYCQYVWSLRIKPTTFALLTQCSTTEPQKHWATGTCLNAYKHKQLESNTGGHVYSKYQLKFQSVPHTQLSYGFRRLL